MRTLAACIGVALLLSPLERTSLAAPQTAQADAGFQALQAGDVERAATIFQDALRKSPRDAALHFGAGVAAHLLGREADAVVSLGKALELQPAFTSAAALLGEIDYREGEMDAAIRVYESALKHEPANTEIRARLEAWRKEGALNDTLEHWNDKRFSLVFEGQANGALGKRAFGVLDAAYQRIGAAIGAYPSGRITVTLYSRDQFRDITHLPAWADGAFDGTIRIPVQGAAQNLVEFDRVLAHELTHAMVHNLANRGVPAWLHEGLASYFEPGDAAAAARRVKTLRAIAPLSALQESFASLPAGAAAIAYEESLVAADVVMQKLGAHTAILLQYLGRGESFDDSLWLLGLQPADFQAAFNRRVR